MDSSAYKQTSTRRGYTYSYYVHGLEDGSKLAPILFLHGFPSTSQDWALQAQFFTGKGYPVIVPDLLGYGGTSSPDDARAYSTTRIAEDVIDVLDAKKVEKVILVAHDWGANIGSKLVNIAPERLQAVAFLCVGYFPPQPSFDYEQQMVQAKALLGSEMLGYWELLASDDGPGLCQQNIDSFYSLLFPQDPGLWVTDLAPRGKARQWIENNKQGEKAGFFTKEVGGFFLHESI
ncbi:hypothetical protein HGRIS_008537 [Hohenbuehelia grisea]|uniref:AB hydrolase-1 domain-containing protein n=1 Tax=Hohenbuehelia grisea TaxID=104357 RepID=A0ABR3J8G3_9AGAR